MRAFLVLALALGLSVPGCAMTTHQKHVGYAVGTVVAVAGVVALIAANRPCDPDTDIIDGVGCIMGSLTLNGIGLALAAVGVTTVGGTALSPTLDNPNEHLTIASQPGLAAMPSNEPTLVELTERASMAGRVGQCKVVIAIAERVEMRDPDYRFGDFVSDGAIAGCL